MPSFLPEQTTERERKKKEASLLQFPLEQRSAASGRADWDGGKYTVCFFFAGCEVFAEAATLREQDALPGVVVSYENIPARSRTTELAAPESCFAAARLTNN